MESKVKFCLVLFSMRRLMILRSPLTTSADVDQILLMASDERGGGARTTEKIVGRERTCDFEFQRWLWL